MWQKRLKKTIFLLNIGKYAPEITDITYPFIKRYAKRIDAGIHIIERRKFPGWDMDYEKLQIFELSQKMQNDWNLYIDSDALIHPDLPDITELIPRDTVAHNGNDHAGVRWTYDRFFRRDGRHISSCNWMAAASDLCIDLWKPLEDLTFEQALANIRLTRSEELSGVVTREHLISDYALSRNIAMYGLKFTTLNQVLAGAGNFFWHIYTVSVGQKVEGLKKVIEEWKV